ncbi:MAG: ferritin family protein [Candidatus Borkfalkiaceae bacterium]|nr:ferritin family protein [Clostridia bacterium]MDY6223213.1 ferritin family protein [Christensenellaceae bacterium]
MQFDNTQTFKNLARAFAGESQAGMRYQLVAKTAMDEGYKTLADEVRTLAKNETFHAQRFFETIQEKTGGKENIDIHAGYPFHSGSLAESLAFAAADEKAETIIYPEFAATAKQEGFEDVAALFTLVSKVEESHRIIFEYLANAVKTGTLYTAESPTLWVCSNCGHMWVGEKAWKICPLCKSEQGYVDLHLPFEGTRI